MRLINKNNKHDPFDFHKIRGKSLWIPVDRGEDWGTDKLSQVAGTHRK